MKNMDDTLSRVFVRDLEGPNLMEIFFVTAVASILVIRGFLHLLGYPQFSPGSLHIAHVLVGGLFMLVAMIIFQAFTGRSVRSIAAFVGGFGFGAFIDEIGKFITADNDYFFKPTVAIIYTVFVLLYLLMQHISRSLWLSDKERLVNVLELTKEAVTQDLRSEDLQKANSLVKEADPRNPVTIALMELMEDIKSIPAREPDIWMKIKRLASSTYIGLARKPWFTKAVIGLFVTITLVAILISSMNIISLFIVDKQLPPLTLSSLIKLAAGLMTGTYVAVGIFRIRSDKLRAYRLFETGVLIQILLTEIFVFMEWEFLGLIKLVGDINVLITLNYVISQETRSEEAAL